MAHFGKLRSVELTDEEKIDALRVPALCDRPDYPYGLRLSLDQRTCAKLGLDPHDCEVGDVIDMRCFGEIMSVSVNKCEDKETCCVEIQIQRIAVENEDREGADISENDDDD